MKKIPVLLIVLGMLMSSTVQSQEWMRSLDVAKRLAVIQDKMIFMVWEEATTYPFPVLVNDERGRPILIRNMFESESIDQIIWEHFVPVIVSESEYDKLYTPIEGKRPQRYIDAFNDDGIKILDANGNLLNTAVIYAEYLNLSDFIAKYYINTEFLQPELDSYVKGKNYVAALRLAAKYIDAAVEVNARAKKEVLDLSTIYLDEAKQLLMSADATNKVAIQQKIELLRLSQQLVINKPKRVLRALNKMQEELVYESNEPLVAYLYYTAHVLRKDEEEASTWRNKLSLVNLKRAIRLIEINRK